MADPERPIHTSVRFTGDERIALEFLAGTLGVKPSTAIRLVIMRTAAQVMESAPQTSGMTETGK